MKRAFEYTRFSSDKQRDESIIAQKRAIALWASKNNIQIIKSYSDEAESAMSDDRTNFQRMFKDIEKFKPDYILVHKYDRFARNRYDSAIYKRKLQIQGVKLIAVDQPVEDTPEGVMMESMLEGMAEYYSKNLAREVMKGLKENALKAKFNGGLIPLGLDVDEENHFIINEEEAPIIKLIFDMKVARASYGEIQDELNKRGYRTRRGKPFGKNSLYSILRNEKYCGTYIYNQASRKIAGKSNHRIKKNKDEMIIIEDAIPAIISKEIFEEVQKMMDENKLTSPRSRSKEIYILTGVLRCGECGGAMTGRSTTKTSKGEKIRHHYYQCSRARNVKDCSHSKNYPKKIIETKILEQLENNLFKLENIDSMTEALWREIQEINSGRDERQINLELQLKEVTKRFDNLLKAIESGANSQHLIESFNEAGDQKKYLENELSEYRSPFEGFTKKMIKDYLINKTNEFIDYDDLISCKKQVAEYINSATIWPNRDEIEVISKYHLGSLNYGSGGAVLLYANLFPFSLI